MVYVDMSVGMSSKAYKDLNEALSILYCISVNGSSNKLHTGPITFYYLAVLRIRSTRLKENLLNSTNTSEI